MGLSPGKGGTLNAESVQIFADFLKESWVKSQILLRIDEIENNFGYTYNVEKPNQTTCLRSVCNNSQSFIVGFTL